MKADRLLAVIVAVLGTMWVLADELDDLFPKSNKVVAEGGGVKVFRLELDAAVTRAHRPRADIDASQVDSNCLEKLTRKLTPKCLPNDPNDSPLLPLYPGPGGSFGSHLGAIWEHLGAKH